MRPPRRPLASLDFAPFARAAATLPDRTPQAPERAEDRDPGRDRAEGGRRGLGAVLCWPALLVS